MNGVDAGRFLSCLSFFFRRIAIFSFSVFPSLLRDLLYEKFFPEARCKASNFFSPIRFTVSNNVVSLTLFFYVSRRTILIFRIKIAKKKKKNGQKKR